jgi:hypothetical protein
MITLDQFRERLRRPEKASTDWAKWIGSPTAWLALLLSAFSVYGTLVRKTDDLRVVTHRKPSAVVQGQQVEFLALDQDLILINSGNRAAAVTEITLILWFQDGNESVTCDHDHYQPIYLNYDFSPVVVKPGEMSSLSLSRFIDYNVGIKGILPVEYEMSDGKLTSASFKRAPKAGDIMAACLSFRIILPDSDLRNASVLLETAPGEKNFYIDYKERFTAPVVLVKN